MANQSDSGNKVLKQFGESRMISYRQVLRLIFASCLLVLPPLLTVLITLLMRGQAVSSTAWIAFGLQSAQRPCFLFPSVLFCEYMCVTLALVVWIYC